MQSVELRVYCDVKHYLLVKIECFVNEHGVDAYRFIETVKRCVATGANQIPDHPIKSIVASHFMDLNPP